MTRPGALLAVLFLLAAPFAAARAHAQEPAPVTDAERKEFRDGLAAAGAGDTFDLVLKYYRDDYLAFETPLIQDARSGAMTALQVQNRTYTFMKGIRDRVMPYTKSAPAPDLIAFARGQVDLMAALKPVSPRMCFEYVEYGGPSQDAVINLPPGFMPRLSAHNRRQFEASAKGQAHPAERTKPSADDFKAAFAVFVANGGDQTWIQAVANGKPRPQDDTGRCAAAITWLKAVLSLPEEQSARLLSQ